MQLELRSGQDKQGRGSKEWFGLKVTFLLFVVHLVHGRKPSFWRVNNSQYRRSRAGQPGRETIPEIKNVLV